MNTKVYTYCLSRPRMAVLGEACADVGLEVCDTQCATDLIACNSILVVLDPDAVGSDEIEHCLDLIAVLEDPTLKVLMTSAAEYCPKELAQSIIVPKTWSRERLAQLLGQLRRDSLRRQTHIARYREPLRRVLFIRERLNTRRKVTVAEVAQAFKVSSRTVHRDIELLRNAGWPVIYDRSGRAYWSTRGRR